MTNEVGAITIGVCLLVLNVLFVVVIGLGARETVKRASRAIEKASRRTVAIARRATTLPFGRTSLPAASASAELELGTMYPSTEQPEDGRSYGSVVENPMTAGAGEVVMENPILHSKEAKSDGESRPHKSDGESRPHKTRFNI